MMMFSIQSNKFKIIVVVLVVGLFSCSKEEGSPLAKVYDNYLYEKDIEGLVPEGLSSSDSLSFVQNYIKQWVESQIILNKAKKNIDDDFTRQLEDYKNSLILNSYEAKIVNQLIDTNVSQQEIEKYYNENLDNFILRDNIVKLLYIKLDKKSGAINQIKNIFSKETISEKDLLQLDNISKKSSINSFLDPNVWIIFNDIIKEIPINPIDKELFLKTNKIINVSDNNFTFLVKILEYKISNSTSPISFEKQTIRGLILNKRKIEIINKMKKELLKEAYDKKEVEIFSK